MHIPPHVLLRPLSFPPPPSPDLLLPTPPPLSLLLRLSTLSRLLRLPPPLPPRPLPPGATAALSGPLLVCSTAALLPFAFLLPLLPSTWTTMASKLQSNCQLEGTVRRHPTWFELVPVIFRRIKAFHPATVSSCFKAGPLFYTFIQFLESESGWESYPTCQGTP